VYPGGFGTLDEMFEALTLTQTGKVTQFPVVLVGTQYWSGLLRWLADTVAVAGNIATPDLDLITCTDDLDEVVAVLTQADLRRREQDAARAARGGSDGEGADPMLA
jgi:predicted Rossmann-fold nucleotide-binding protein